jgi:predicted nucleotidyltransferase component of viral defense system
MIEIIKEKLTRYGAMNAIEEEQAIKEIMQEIAVYALWRADFFDIALFQGGTSLRILHNLPRFSEDLDFMLRIPDPEFDWAAYLKIMIEVFAQFGLKLDARPKEKMETSIRQAIVKDDSIASQLDLTFAGAARRKTIQIKLEIDTNPPLYSGEANSFLDFPSDYEVRHQDLSSNFALKIHALLCRPYVKGRDWYDFSWYVSHTVSPNFVHLQAALIQAGPWARQDGLTVDREWLVGALQTRIAAIDWDDAIRDVRRFLRPTELKSVELWGARFFLTKTDKMAQA